MLAQDGNGSMSATVGDEHAACPPSLPAAGVQTSLAVAAPLGPQKVTQHPETLPCQTCISV